MGGADRDFQVATLGAAWVAITDLGDVAITITARSVEISQVRLVEIADAPPPPSPKFRPRPSPRNRTLPEPPRGIDEPVNVELTYRDRRLLTGTVGGDPLELAVILPVSRGTAQGRLGAAEITAKWRSSTEPVSLTGTLGPLRSA